MGMSELIVRIGGDSSNLEAMLDRLSRPFRSLQNTTRQFTSSTQNSFNNMSSRIQSNISNMTSRITNRMQNLRTNLNNTLGNRNQVFNQFTQSFNRITQNIRNFASQSIRLLHNFSRSVLQSISAVRDFAKAAGQKIVMFGGSLTQNLTTPIMGLIKQGLQYNMTIENLQTSFKVLLGTEKAAIAMTQKLKKMGAETPFEMVGLAEATKTLLAFGVPVKKVLPIMRRLGDVSLGNAERFKSLNLVMGQVSAAGKLQGQDLLQFVNAGWNPLQQIVKRTGETMEEVKNRMSKGKVGIKEVEQALIDATSKGERYYKGMEEGSKTLSGRLSTLQDNFNELLGNATAPLFDFLSKKVVPILSKAVESFNKLSTPIKNTIIGIVGVLGVLGPIIVGVGIFITLIGSVVGVIGTFVTALSSIGVVIPIVVGYISLISTGIIALILSSKNVRNSIITAFGSIMNTIKTAANWVVKNIDTIKKAFIGLFTGIQSGNFKSFSNAMLKLIPAKFKPMLNNTISNILDFRKNAIIVRDSLIDFGLKLLKIVKPSFEQLKNTIMSLDFKTIITTFIQMRSSIMELAPLAKMLAVVVGGVLAIAFSVLIGVVNGFIKAIPNLLAGFMSIYTLISSALTLVIGIITLDGEKIKTAFSNTWIAVKGIFVNAFMAIYNLVSGFVSGIIVFFTNLYNVLVGNSIIPDMINGIISWFGRLPSAILGILSNVRNFVISTWNNIKSSTYSIWSGIKQTVINTFSNIKSGISSKVSSIKTTVINMGSSIKSSLSGLAASAYSWGVNLIDGFLNGITSKIDKVKNVVKNLTNTIADYIKCESPAKLGPLSNLYKWGEGLTEGYAKGMLMNEKLLQKASIQTANIAGREINSNVALNSGNSRNSGFNYIQNGPVLNQQTIQHIANMLARKIKTGGI